MFQVTLLVIKNQVVKKVKIFPGMVLLKKYPTVIKS